MELNPEFIRSLGALPGCDAAALVAALDTPAPVSVRFNPFKVTEKPEGEQVPWCRYGYYLPERPSFTHDPAFHGGVYYVQEAGSMFVEHLLRQAFGEEGCQGLRVLDLCASPGGKTTLLSTLVGLEGLVVANETVRPRIGALVENAWKWGLGNVVVTHNDPVVFSRFEHLFDAVLVDAPCSGEGMMRKDDQARAEWSPAAVKLCAARQRRILSEVWECLKPGGVMIYSTCTFNREENEENVAWMMRELGCEGISVDAGPTWGVVTGEVAEGEERVCTSRFYPDKTRSEGFFAALLRKPDGRVREKMPAPKGVPCTEVSRAEAKELARWTDQPGYMDFTRIGENLYGYYTAQGPLVRQLAARLTALYSGMRMGQLFHGSLRPDHPLALFTGLARGVFPEVSLPEEKALAYLRRQQTDAGSLAEGLNLVCCEGLPIGWAKRIGTRVNNMYPKEMAIRN